MGTLTKSMTEEILQKYEVTDLKASLPAPSIGKSPQPNIGDDDNEDEEGSDAGDESSNDHDDDDDDDDDAASSKKTRGRKTKVPKRGRDTTPSPKPSKKAKHKKHEDELEQAMEVGSTKNTHYPSLHISPNLKKYSQRMWRTSATTWTRSCRYEARWTQRVTQP